MEMKQLNMFKVGFTVASSTLTVTNNENGIKKNKTNAKTNVVLVGTLV